MRTRMRRVRTAAARPFAVLVAWLTIQRRSAAFVVFGTVGLVLIRVLESATRHTLNRPEWVDWAVVSMLTLLGLTHVFLSVVMWIQREGWTPTEASMFRWIYTKAMLWGDLATSYVMRGIGVRLDIAYLYILIAVTTIDMDYKMVRRYLMGRDR